MKLAPYILNQNINNIWAEKFDIQVLQILSGNKCNIIFLELIYDIFVIFVILLFLVFASK